MRDHKRRTEIRLIVLGEDACRIKEGTQREQAHPDEEGRESARYWIALHVQRFLFFSNLPPEFRECNPSVPWGRLRSLRQRYGSASIVTMTMPRTFKVILRFAREEVPEIQRLLALPNYPKHWRNEPAGELGIEEVLGPYRGQILRLARKYGVRRLRIYGSVARGEADKRSDVDFLVEWGPKTKHIGRLGLHGELERVIRRRVDLHDSSSIYWATRDRVLSEAVDFR
jgi:uncharacterized protein